jgi:hypothetical protein
MTDSILTSTKKILGLAEEYTVFDLDIMTHINSALMYVSQLGIGPAEGFSVEGPETTWEELLGNSQMLNPVKSYVYLRVRLLFDPPNTSFLINALEDQLREMEWRLNVYREGNAWSPPLPFDTVLIDGGSP